MTLVNLLLNIACIGAPVVTGINLFMRIKKRKENTAGYIYNGKTWVAWLFALSAICTLILFLAMGLMDKHAWNWGYLWMIAIAIFMFVCYAIIASRPATAEELEAAKAAGSTVTEDVAGATTSILAGVGMAALAGLAALPGMIFSALNPVIAVKTIGGTVYNVIGGGIHSILGIVMLAFALLLVVFAILTVCFLFSLFGPFAIGLIVIVKFVLNLQYFK